MLLSYPGLTLGLKTRLIFIYCYSTWSEYNKAYSVDITLFIVIFYISLILLSKNLTDLITFINKEPWPTGSGSLLYGRLHVLR